MKSLTETYTPLIKNLRDLNKEIRRRHSFMHSYTEQEMKSLEVWLEEAEQLARDLENLSLIIFQHLQISKTKLRERQVEATSKG